VAAFQGVRPGQPHHGGGHHDCHGDRQEDSDAATQEQHDHDGGRSHDGHNLCDADQRGADRDRERGDGLEHPALERLHAVAQRDGADVAEHDEGERADQTHHIRRAADARRPGQRIDDRACRLNRRWCQRSPELGTWRRGHGRKCRALNHRRSTMTLGAVGPHHAIT